uniref:CCHC-type domain-containing protein n=1 Tax=Tanacetum cinerariifolium TaxID=118510 RepID=A0A6L2K3J7_TANCI|nr:hypothetical protein [Tanacetum cinerariifolium]
MILENVLLHNKNLSAEQAFWLRISNPTIESSLPPVKVEVSSELLKVSLVNESLKNLKFQLAQFDSMVKKRTTPNALTEEHEDLKAQIQDKVFVITSLKNNLRKLKEKATADNAAQIPSATTVVPGMFKLDLEPLAPKLLHDRKSYIFYLKHTYDHADILQGIVEQAKAKQPLDNELEFTRKHAKRIQELLVYVQDTCPSAIRPSETKVARTPMNKIKKVTFAKPIATSSTNQETHDSNKPMFHSTGVKCSTSASGSKPSGNTKNNRISQPSSSNKINKVEDQPRSIKTRKNNKNRVKKVKCDDHVMQSSSNVNSVFVSINNAPVKIYVNDVKTSCLCVIVVMSDTSSAVPYTSVYTDSEPWRYYIPYITKPEYPKYLAPSDEEAPLEDQPLPADSLPIAASPDYVADSDSEEDPKEDPEDDQADYPTDGGDGDDETYDDDDADDTDDEDPKEEPFKDEEDDEEEEEHPALGDSPAVPIIDLVLPARDTEALEADEPTHAPGSPIIIPFSQTRLCRARKTVRPEPPMSAFIEACIARHAALPSPPLLVPSLPLPLPSPLTTSPTDTRAPLGYRAAEIRMRALIPSTSYMTDIPEAEAPQKRAFLTTPTLGFKIGESFVAGVARQPGPIESNLRRYMVEQAEIDQTTIAQLCSWIERRCTMDRSSAIEAYVRTLETQKMAPKKRTIRATPATPTTPTTTITNAQLQALIDRGVATALAERDVDMSRNGDNSNDSGTVKFTSCTLQESALTWWNSHMRTVGQDVAYLMPWADLKRMITDKMFPEESAKVERYIGGLPAEHKRKFDNTSRNTQHQQQPFKRNNVARAYTARPGDKKPYGRTKPLCPKCNYHHDGPCALKCTNCKKIGHLARDCKGRHAAANNNNQNNNNNNKNQRAQGANAKGITCFKCRVQGHYKSDCPKLKNGNQGNRARNGNAVERAYVVGTAITNPNSNVVMGTFLLNNRYASFLFDTGA